MLLERTKTFLLVLVSLCLLATLTGFGLAFVRTWFEPLKAVESVFTERTFRVYPNVTLHELAHQLFDEGLASHPDMVKWYIKHKGWDRKIRWGEYHVRPEMSLQDLLHNIIHAKGMVAYRVTIPEGETFAGLLSTLRHNPNLSQQFSGMSDRAVMRDICQCQQRPEGMFFPDTYQFTWGNTERVVLQQAYDRMRDVMGEAWAERDAGLPYKNWYEALIVASLIEAETPVMAERPVVSSVILNRLTKRMRLQIDPTVMYGLGKPYGSELSKRDLRKKTPYNTYVIYGLPPTPIMLPSLTSIEAALHPAKTDYLYFVATGEGGHVFSKSYKGQRRAVKRYRQKQVDINQQQDEVLSIFRYWQQRMVKLTSRLSMILAQ